MSFAKNMDWMGKERGELAAGFFRLERSDVREERHRCQK
jgi:hypothetical protein